MKYALIALLVTLLIAAGGILYFNPKLIQSLKPKTPGQIKTFEDCAAAGNLVVNTQPRECHTKDNRTFIEVYNGTLLKDVIKTTAPEPNAVVTSPFKLEGEAVGGWYYNNQLNIKLEDDNGKVIFTAPVKALKSTKTDAFVPFVAAVSYLKADAATPKGKLIIERTNPYFSRGEMGPLIIPVEFGN